MPPLSQGRRVARRIDQAVYSPRPVPAAASPEKRREPPYSAGPWFAQAGPAHIIIRGADGDSIASMARVTPDRPAPEQDDNARLIEAAPELVDAVEGLLAEWDLLTRYGSPLAKKANPRVAAARALLARVGR